MNFLKDFTQFVIYFGIVVALFISLLFILP